MARAVVDDEEQLSPAVAAKEKLEERPERDPVEDWRELIGEARVGEGDGTIDVGRFSQAVRIYPRLHANAAPGLMERAIEPEARLVFEEDYTPAGGCFFLIAGRTLRSQKPCASKSARASLLRGRCTEKPSW